MAETMIIWVVCHGPKWLKAKLELNAVDGVFAVIYPIVVGVPVVVSVIIPHELGDQLEAFSHIYGNADAPEPGLVGHGVFIAFAFHLPIQQMRRHISQPVRPIHPPGIGLGIVQLLVIEGGGCVSCGWTDTHAAAGVADLGENRRRI